MAFMSASPLLLNSLSLALLASGAYYAIGFRRKPVLAWSVPLHLSYQDYSVKHSRSLAGYDFELWNHVISACGALVAALTIIAFQSQRKSQSSSTSGRRVRHGLHVTTALVAALAACVGSFVSSSLLGIHPATWSVTSPIRQVSTAAITAELTRVPAATPWDLGWVMLRSAFERTVMQKGHGALDVTHRYLSRHLREQRLQIGTTIYPSIRTHGVGVAPVPWTRNGYRVAPEHRVLSYEPIVAGTNVTVLCSDTTTDWKWDYERIETHGRSDGQLIVHNFEMVPNADWNSRGSQRTIAYVDGNRGLNLETWLAIWKSPDGQDMQPRQIFAFTSISVTDHQPRVQVFECAYGGVDVVRQVYMTSPMEPIVYGHVWAVKDRLTFEDLWPAAVAIDEALGRDGGMMLAGLTAAKFTSFEVWDLFQGRTLEVAELVENVLVDTAQAYFSLVRQWKEEAQFFSWKAEFPSGGLTATTRQLGSDGTPGLVALVMVGLLGCLPLVSLIRPALQNYRATRGGDVVGNYEIRDGILKKKAD
ncbi:hypothetical protein QBC47DRAFT_371068 [Echria macrotheca]|uniref:Uncharacterized protein n=1 Tax=Echria macrotheca TaxID=438768 RepID=A0AAJ0F8H5_9PEZI|nr:hypothetical protein QBC47DRAFT_371068 [Echria macrotheca]